MQNGSCECTKSGLDMHSVPPTMTTMQDAMGGLPPDRLVRQLSRSHRIRVASTHGILHRLVTKLPVPEMQNSERRWQ